MTLASRRGRVLEWGMFKILVAFAWIVSLVAWSPLWSDAPGIVRWIAPIMGVTHVVEFALFRQLFEKAGGSMGSHFVQTFIYGVAYINPLKESLGAESPAP